VKHNILIFTYVLDTIVASKCLIRLIMSQQTQNLHLAATLHQYIPNVD